MSGELDLIERIRQRAARPAAALRLGIGDDCALLRVRPGEDLAVTTDLSIDSRHFHFAWHPPDAVGHRTLARGLSDLAAMGARPLAAFLSLGLPRNLVQNKEKAWVYQFLDGLLKLGDATGTPLAGGDLAESPTFAADIVLVGAVRRGRALLRSGAQPGDLLYVTGALGGAAAGLAKMSEFARATAKPGSPSGPARFPALRIPNNLQEALAPHLYPTPRLAQGQWLARRCAVTAALDISDGLSTDLAHLCEESHVAAEIHATSLPVFPGATFEQALHGGEDYELLFTAPAGARIPRSIAGVPVRCIGRIMRRNRRRPIITLLTSDGPEPLQPRGWEHFSQSSERVKK